MESNENNDYVLILEDRTEVKSEREPGRLSVVSGQDEKGKIKTVEPTEENRAAFLVFKKNDGLLKNFMTNFLRQFNDPKRFGLYKVLANGFEEGVASLHAMLQNRESPENKAQLQEARVPFEDYLPAQKLPAIDPEKVDWKELEGLGVSREKLEVSGDLDRLLNWQKTGLVPLAVPFGNTTIRTEARLALRTGADGRLGLSIHTLRHEPQLDYPYMGHRFSEEEKATLRQTGNLGKTVELSPKSGEPFRAYMSIDPQTNELVPLRADRVQIPHEIKGVQLTDEQHRALSEGRPVKVEGMLSRYGKPFDATLQVNAEKKGIEFIFDDSLSFRERARQAQNASFGSRYGIPNVICRCELTEPEQKTLSEGGTLYLRNLIDPAGRPFNAYVRMDKEQNRPRFYAYDPNKKQAEAPTVRLPENKPQKRGIGM